MVLAFNSLGQFKVDTCCRLRHGKAHVDLRGEVILGEISPHFDCELELEGAQFFDKRIDAERSRVLAIDTVVHDEEFAIRWFDGHCAHVFEITRVDAFVEIAVVEDDTSSGDVISGAAHLQIVVEDESKVWIVMEVTLHLDDAVNA